MELCENKKRKRSFPTAFTILFVITLIAIGLTWVVPAGSYSKLFYDSMSQKLQVTTPTGEINKLPADQKSLDALGINIDIGQFTNGSIRQAYFNS